MNPSIFDDAWDRLAQWGHLMWQHPFWALFFIVLAFVWGSVTDPTR